MSSAQRAKRACGRGGFAGRCPFRAQPRRTRRGRPRPKPTGVGAGPGVGRRRGRGWPEPGRTKRGRGEVVGVPGRRRSEGGQWPRRRTGEARERPRRAREGRPGVAVEGSTASAQRAAPERVDRGRGGGDRVGLGERGRRGGAHRGGVRGG